jgi:putative membrane protein
VAPAGAALVASVSHTVNDPANTAPASGAGGEDVDGSRRTRLANERTYLAWWRTGLASLAVSIGTGRIAPALTDGASWPYVVAGAGFALLGVLLIAFAAIRHRQVEQALERGEPVKPDDAIVLAVTLAGVVLGLFVLVLVVAES